MKMIKLPVLLIAIVLVISFCFVSAVASTTATGEVAVTFNPPSSSSSTPSSSTPSSSTPSSSSTSSSKSGGGTTVPDRDRPTAGVETVSIVDPQPPLTDLGDYLGTLPQTGGNTALPCILIMAGALCLFAAKRDSNARYCLCEG